MPNKQQPGGTERETQMQNICTLAQKVMGWLYWDYPAGDWQGPEGVAFFALALGNAVAVYEDGSEDPTHYWAPYTNIGDAWMLVVKLTEGGKRAFNVKRYQADAQSHEDIEYVWFAAFYDRTDTFNGHGVTAQVAICAAALAASQEKP